ncbi:MAG: hypothetical protein ACM3NW_10110 [Syntrophomonadaceae bacterium]
MTRRLSRAFLALALLFGMMAGRAAGCRKKEKSVHRPAAAPSPAHWITPLMTAPPPRPTPTMWKGVTRAPQLPE